MMAILPGRHDIEFGGPATYRIVVQGAVGESWRYRLAGMAITTAHREIGAQDRLRRKARRVGAAALVEHALGVEQRRLE